MTWSKHPSTKDPERYHLDCDKHGHYKASVIVSGTEFLLHVRRQGVEDDDHVDRFGSLHGLNKFLKLIGLEQLIILSRTENTV